MRLRVPILVTCLMLVLPKSFSQQCINGQCGACTSCTVTSSTSCPTNTLAPAAASSLLNCTCIPGAFVNPPDLGLACSRCLAGSYAPSTGMTACLQCGVGKYQTGTGSSSSADCSQCPSGTYLTGTGSALASDCANCSAGTYSGSLGASSATSCLSCMVGFYSLAQRATSVDTCSKIDNGKYCAVPCGVAPSPCVGLPNNASWISPGTTSTNCQWACNSQYYMLTESSTGCTACPANYWCTANQANICPLNSGSAVLSSAQSQCTCNPGFYGNGSKSSCVQCPAGFWCNGTNSNITFLCPQNTTSAPGASSLSQCQCAPGFYQTNASGCQLCPPNFFCDSGKLDTCPANKQSKSGSSGICTCNAGFYSNVSGGICKQCPANSWCEGDIHIANCTAKALSPAQSVSYLACYCDKGYEGKFNQSCAGCPVGTWCYMGEKYNCPVNSTSPALSSYTVNCSCNPGSTGPDGGPCSNCLPGTYKNNTGSNACTGCALQTFRPTEGATSCLPTNDCPRGWWPNPPYTAVSDNVCQYCPRDYFCRDNARSPCPFPTGNLILKSVSPVGSSSYLNCSCPAGTFGSVTGPAANDATCTPCGQGMYCPGTVCQCSRR